MRHRLCSYCPRTRGLLTALLVMAPLALSGCLVQSKIQGRYIEDQTACRAQAEASNVVDKATQARDRNNQLVTLFSNCMGKRGWQVAKPKRVRTATVDGPHGPLDPYPSTASSRQPAGPVPTQPTTLSPSGGMPALSPPVSGAAQYRPGRADVSTPVAPNYGQGAGRNF